MPGADGSFARAIFKFDGRDRPGRWARLLLAVSVTIGGLLTQTAIAQTLPPCQPPNPGEYLLMVIHQTPDTPTQLQQILPRGVTNTVCDYLGVTVTRSSGFATSELANSWAQYLTQIGGFRAFVARAPQSTPAPTPLPMGNSAPTTPAPQPNVYNPQPLGAGYAVLVNYFNRPEVAADVHQLSQSHVGLVAYEQRPYLLVTYTRDAIAATQWLQALSDRGFSAMMVDGRQAMLLSTDVRW